MAYRSEWCALYSKQILYLWRIMGRTQTISNSIRESARKHWHAHALIAVKCVKKLQLSQRMEPFPMKIRNNIRVSWADSRMPFVNVPPDWATPVQRGDSSLQGFLPGLLSRWVHFLNSMCEYDPFSCLVENMREYYCWLFCLSKHRGS